MPVERRWVAGWQEWKFLFLASRGFHITCNRCAHLSWLFALSLAACTRSGFPDRNTCTACRNAVQNRTWDKAQWAGSAATPCHIARSVRPHASPACSPVSGPGCSLSLQAWRPAFLEAHCAVFPRGPGLDIRAVGILLPQNLPRTAYCLPSGGFRQV
jgi:hypothetical protein